MLNAFPLLGSQVPGLQMIVGSFVVNGASAPGTILPPKAGKFTVSAPVAGRYTVQMLDPVKGVFLGAIACISDNASNSTVMVRTSFVTTIETANAFDIVTQSTNGTDANLAGSQVVTFGVFISESRSVLV